MTADKGSGLDQAPAVIPRGYSRKISSDHVIGFAHGSCITLMNPQIASLPQPQESKTEMQDKLKKTKKEIKLRDLKPVKTLRAAAGK